MSVPVTALAEKFSTLNNLRAAALERLQSVRGANHLQFDLSKPAPGAERPLAEIDARVIAILHMASTLQTIDDFQLIPTTFVNSLNKPVDQISNQYQSIIDNLVSIDNNGGPGNLDPVALSLQSANGGVNLQIGPIFQNIWNHSETVLAALYPLLNIVGGHRYQDFSAALNAFSVALVEIHKQRTDLEGIAKNAQQISDSINVNLKQTTEYRAEIERIKTESEKDRKTLAEYSVEGTQSITTIRTTAEQAERLKSSVDGYLPAFDNFQKQLEQREQLIKQGAEQQEALFKKFTDSDAKITKLNEQAEAMLTGATVAGLAGSFGEIRNALVDDLKIARRTFYVAMALLFISVLPLAIYVIPGLGEVLSLPAAVSHSSTASGSELLGQIAARALLLLPAAWFAKFAAGRHAALFRLKEHYAYKYSVATSVEAFKKQAEPFKDAIAAATFFELTFNPAERMEAKTHEERHPNPVMEWIMKKIGATYDGK